MNKNFLILIVVLLAALGIYAITKTGQVIIPNPNIIKTPSPIGTSEPIATNEPTPIQQPNIPSPTNTVPVPGVMTLQGTFECLPHKDRTGPQTMECAYGFQIAGDKHYAIDMSSMSESAFDLPMNRLYNVTGYFTPVEMLSSNHWQRYDIVGILSVQKYSEVRSGIPSYPAGSTIEMELLKPVIVGNATIRVNSVLQDSRCPKDVQCIQAGKVVLGMSVEVAELKRSFELSPGSKYSLDSVTISLNEVNPYPISTRKTADSEYRFLVSVENLNRPI